MNRKNIPILISTALIIIIAILCINFYIDKNPSALSEVIPGIDQPSTQSADEQAIAVLVSGFVTNPGVVAVDKQTPNSEVDRIEIKNITKNADGTYDVSAEIVELSYEGGTPAIEGLRRGISFKIKSVDGALQIDTFTISAYAGDGEWVYSNPSDQGTQFMYPKTLPTKYITASEWPPKLDMQAGDFVCATGYPVAVDIYTGGANDSESQMGKVEKIMIDDREYCVSSLVEGAAGSTYITYEYVTKQGDFLPHLSFTLRTPQCMNYDEPAQSVCKLEQSTYSVNGLADRIMSSVRMR